MVLECCVWRDQSEPGLNMDSTVEGTLRMYVSLSLS